MEKCKVRTMHGGNTAERVKLIRAMETIARCINDEEVFTGWLMNGVPDGEIKANTTDEELEWLTDDETLEGIMNCFLGRMVGASKSGGLFYSD